MCILYISSCAFIRANTKKPTHSPSTSLSFSTLWNFILTNSCSELLSTHESRLPSSLFPLLSMHMYGERERACSFVILYRFPMLLLLCNWNCTKRFCEQSTIIGYEWAKNNNGNELGDTSEREKKSGTCFHVPFEMGKEIEGRERAIVGERMRDGECIQNE